MIAAPDIALAVARDIDAAPLSCLRHLMNRVRGPARHRVGDALALVDEPGGVELFLAELFECARRQIGGSMMLGPTFVRMVGDLDLDGLPVRSRLLRLATLAKAKPIPCPQPRLLAHALARDGHLAALLTSGPAAVLGIDGDADKAAARAAYRRLVKQHHPDRNPDDPDAARRFDEITKAFKELAA